MSAKELFFLNKINYISHVPKLWISILASDPAAKVLIPTIPEKFSEGKIANVAKVKRKEDISLKMLIDSI